MTNRLPDWRSRLHNLISDLETVPFAYGQNDCAILSGRVVEALTGEDQYSHFVGRYKTKLGGFRAFRKATGYRSHIEFIQSTFDETPLAFAQDGDLAFVETEDGIATVVICGHFAIGIGEYGIQRFSISEILSAFKVGRA